MDSISIGNPPITQAWLGIWYTPIGDEPDPSGLALVAERGLSPWKIVTPDPSRNPIQLAQELSSSVDAIHSVRGVYLLIPGRRFDAFGTRHGRGGGWYDRFLSQLPRSWLRIGVCGPSQWSEGRLTRKVCDEPMDYILRIDLSKR